MTKQKNKENRKNDELKQEYSEKSSVQRSLDNKTKNKKTENLNDGEVLEDSEVKEKLIEINIDYKERYLRAIADLENYKKRIDKEREEIRNISKFYVVSEFLSLYNNLKQAESFIPEEMYNENWVVGIKMIADQFEKKLNEMGIEVEHTEGKKFDHNLMEAVSTEANKEKEEDLVLKELSPCYKMDGKVIEHARVIVNKIL